VAALENGPEQGIPTNQERGDDHPRRQAIDILRRTRDTRRSSQLAGGLDCDLILASRRSPALLFTCCIRRCA